MVKRLGTDRLEDLPGIGPSIADDLRRIGIHEPRQLRGVAPEALFDRLQAVDGPTDRCVLYTFRCAQHFVECDGVVRPADLLQWWNWKDDDEALTGYP